MKKMEEKLKKIVEEQNLEQENPEELALLLWQVLKQYEQVEFQTVKGLAFTYVIKATKCLLTGRKSRLRSLRSYLRFKIWLSKEASSVVRKSLEHLGRVIYIRFLWN